MGAKAAGLLVLTGVPTGSISVKKWVFPRPSAPLPSHAAAAAHAPLCCRRRGGAATEAGAVPPRCRFSLFARRVSCKSNGTALRRSMRDAGCAMLKAQRGPQEKAFAYGAKHVVLHTALQNPNLAPLLRCPLTPCRLPERSRTRCRARLQACRSANTPLSAAGLFFEPTCQGKTTSLSCACVWNIAPSACYEMRSHGPGPTEGGARERRRGAHTTLLLVQATLVSRRVAHTRAMPVHVHLARTF